MQHVKADYILAKFNDSLRLLNLNKMMLTSVDGPNANWKFSKSLKRYRLDNEQHQLIDIGLCGLHIIHRAFKTGAESSNWELKKVLKGKFTLLHEWSAKRNDYDSLTVSNTFPLFFCRTS